MRIEVRVHTECSANHEAALFTLRGRSASAIEIYVFCIHRTRSLFQPLRYSINLLNHLSRD